MKFLTCLLGLSLCPGLHLLSAPSAQHAQPAPQEGQGFGLIAAGEPRVDIAWNRLRDQAGLHGLLDRIASAWPGFLSYEVIGHSIGGREMRVYTLSSPGTPAGDKPAMWVEGNVHGNETQGGEAVVYLAWYLLENYETSEVARELLDRSTLYLLPSVNPDGRDSWLQSAHSASSSRSGVSPIDNDRDGRFDEDPPDDLDGDGHIVQMRKYVPGEGTHRLNADDPRVMEGVPANDFGLRGDWIYLGSEGIDNDGDGRINEDGVGGYDMNRSWPSLWKPGHVQYGAGDYPLYWPETRSIARFLYAHPNVAAVQSFHNAGGMILRGPGAEVFGSYPRADLAVYDELGEDGEKMLPFYRYMIIWKDLYSVFGGFVTWTYEGLGIISFTNELWASERMSPDEKLSGSRRDRLFFDDHLLLGQGFIDWHEVEHPLYGTIEIGGFKKDVGRVPPSFLLEEELHRNALFCVRHARAMPEVEIGTAEFEQLGDGLFAIDVIYENLRPIPTRTAQAANNQIGRPDLFRIEGENLEVLAGGFRSSRFRPEQIELAKVEPERLVREAGISGRGRVRVRWFVKGSGRFELHWSGEKGLDVTRSFELP